MVFPVIHEFFSAEEEVGVNMSPSFGKTNRKFFILITCQQFIHIVLQISAILAVLSSISRDAGLNYNIMHRVQIFERNAQDLEEIFGTHWKLRLCRVSPEQLTFFVGSIACGILYLVHFIHFVMYQNFRVRVLWTGLFHCLVLLMQITLLIFICISYFRAKEELKRTISRIQFQFNSPHAKHRLSTVETFYSLIEKGRPIYYYCFNGEPSVALRRRLDDTHLCPAKRHKIFALIMTLIDVILMLGTIITIIVWHYSALEVADFGEEGNETDSNDDDSSTEEEEPSVSGGIREVSVNPGGSSLRDLSRLQLQPLSKGWPSLSKGWPSLAKGPPSLSKGPPSLSKGPPSFSLEKPEMKKKVSIRSLSMDDLRSLGSR